MTRKKKMENKQIEFSWTPAQLEYLEDPTRFKVVAKGRRFGATVGAAMYIVRNMMLQKNYKALWVDVIYGNINRYYNRCFLPMLSKLPKEIWDWSIQQKQLTFSNGNYLDMRSADRRESLEGFGYNFIFLNEAGIILKDRNLWNITLAPMALDYKASVLFAGTPKGKRDISHGGDNKLESLYYELYQKGLKGEPGWKSWQYTSYDNITLDPSEIDTLANEIPSVIRRQEFFGEFIDITENAIFHSDWFDYVDVPPEPFTITMKIMSLDTAYTTKTTSDYSACVVIYKTVNAYYVVDCINVKIEFPDLIKLCEDMYDKHRVDSVLVEGKASGQSLIQMIQSQGVLPVKEIQPGSNDKLTRAAGVSPLCEAHKVKIVKGPWNKMFMDQVLNFPSGYDDLVDAFSQGLFYLKNFEEKIGIITASLRRSPIQGMRSISVKNTIAKGYNETKRDTARSHHAYA